MMTRVFLAAGVAALAIAAPASAKPDREGRQAAKVERSGGGQRAQAVERRQARADRPQRAERTQRVERQQRVAQRAERPQRVERQRAERVQRAERIQRPDRIQRVERRAERVQRPERIERQAARVERQQIRANRIDRSDRTQARMADRQQIRGNNRVDRIQDRVLVQDNRFALKEQRKMMRDQLRTERLMNRDALRAQRQINRDDLRAYRQLAQRDLQSSRFASIVNYNNAAPLLAPLVVSQYVGQPVSTLSQLAGLSVLPQSVQYLYPDNDDYYYRYGGGYVYRVERDNDLIDYILPLLAGGFMPGQYLPTNYMNSYVPNQYGLNSFYPASYAGYGGGFGYDDDICNRYYGGVVYQVDCSSGYIEDVVPLYASGYGVGQMLPSSYSHYNLPSQYRSLYYNTDDYNYWYAPGAIYQYDPSSSLITSVAALLTPGFSVGQQMPMGYSMYNVPMSYRDTYYDTPNAWYRYNNGNIYQVDPTTQLVTAIVASILT